MKLIIEVTETIYEMCKEWQEANVSNWSENIIANGTPYEERPQGKWIPINSIEDIPKDRMLFVTLDNGYVETLYYDMTEWSDNEYARHAVAYMDYWKYQPMPYRGDV